jgi:hypothetical protein
MPEIMEVEELNGIMSDLGWSRRYVAQQWGVSEPTVRRWGSTPRSPVPGDAAEWLRACYAVWKAAEPFPAPPGGWVEVSKISVMDLRLEERDAEIRRLRDEMRGMRAAG